MLGNSWAKVLGGFLLGTVGVPLLKTDVAKKVYKYATAGAFIARDRVLEEAENLQAFATDVADDARVIVEEYYQQKDAVYEAEIFGRDADETEGDNICQAEPVSEANVE